MQQIQPSAKNKKMPNHQHLLICNNVLVRLVDYRWNQIYQSLIRMYEKLAKLGLIYHNGNVIIAEQAYPDASK